MVPWPVAGGPNQPAHKHGPALRGPLHPALGHAGFAWGGVTLLLTS